MANSDEAGFLQDRLDFSFSVSREGGNTNWRGVDGKSMTMPEGKKKKRAWWRRAEAQRLKVRHRRRLSAYVQSHGRLRIGQSHRCTV